ncbi:unnamed protein product [Vicia faba]|uniref:Beta-catenin-like protein 1 N-terminal domain-containing protein n=1 Tax=Vicia faba TaxID=3906 RepID=A0AAV0YR35_VICFA|nr:unnamed protein product [Vicia faba]
MCGGRTLFMRQCALELLVHNLHRLLESDPDENASIYNMLSTIENLIEVKLDVTVVVCKKTKLLKWLLENIKSSYVNQKKVREMNGVNVVLLVMPMFKSKDPKSLDEEEMVENLFDCLSFLLMSLENKERFVKAERVKLMILIM